MSSFSPEFNKVLFSLTTIAALLTSCAGNTLADVYKATRVSKELETQKLSSVVLPDGEVMIIPKEMTYKDGYTVLINVAGIQFVPNAEIAYSGSEAKVGYISYKKGIVLHILGIEVAEDIPMEDIKAHVTNETVDLATSMHFAYENALHETLGAGRGLEPPSGAYQAFIRGATFLQSEQEYLDQQLEAKGIPTVPSWNGEDLLSCAQGNAIEHLVDAHMIDGSIEDKSDFLLQITEDPNCVPN